MMFMEHLLCAKHGGRRLRGLGERRKPEVRSTQSLAPREDSREMGGRAELRASEVISFGHFQGASKR